MNNVQAIESGYNQTSSGSIDYQFYDQQARDIRSDSVWGLLKGLFSDKKSSRVEASKECEVIDYNVSKSSSAEVNPMKQAA